MDDLSTKFGGLDNSVVEYLNNTERGQASMNGLSKSIDNSATSMISATAKAKLLAVALNALTGLAISLAIKGITWAVDELIVTLDEQKEKLDEAVTAYEESKSELEQINDELKTTGERIDELNGKENLTFTEQDELEKLIKANDELERKIYLLEQANKEAEKEVATEAQSTYDKYTNNRSLGAVEQIEFYADSSLLEGVNWDNFKGDLSWLVAQYENQKEILANAQSNGWETIEEQAKSNLTLLEGYMSEASLDYQDLYDKISGISDFAMTDDLKVAKQDLDDILNIVAEILGYGGQRSETTFDDIWNSENFSQYKTELETLSKNGRLDASVLESNENYKKLLENIGATAEDTAQHINALVDEMEKTGSQNLDELDNILTLDQAKIKVEGSDETIGLIEEFTLLQEVLSDTGNVSIETYEKLLTCSDKYSSALKIEAGRIVVDSQKLKLLNKTRTNAIKTEVKEASTLKKLQWINEAKRIQQYRKQQIGLTDNIWDTCDSLQEEINKFDMLVQGIDSASNAFTNFQNAQNASESGDYFDIGLEMANEIQKGLETGKVGIPDFIEAIKGAMPEDLFADIFTMDDEEAQLAKIRDWYENVYSQFFIEGEDAEYDISGLENFAKKVEELGYGTYEKLKDGSFHFQLNEHSDLEKLAEEMRLNKEQVYAILGEFDEYDLGQMFDFDSKNYIDDYYNDLNQLTEAQRLYNEALESGNKYQIQIANKMLADAQEEYTEHFTNLADAILQKEQEWQNSSSDKSFADYLLQSYDATELTEILDNAKYRVEEIKNEMQQIEKVGQTNSTTYRELGAELENLETCIGSLENIEDRTTLIGKATETVVNNFKRFTELVDIIQNSDMGSEELAQATQEAMELVNQLGYIPDSVKFTIESNVKEIDAEISTLNSEIESMKKLAASTTSTSMQQAIQSSINTKQTKVDGLTEQSTVLHGILDFDTKQAFADIEKFKAEDVNKEGTVTYSADFSNVSNATPPTLDGVVNYEVKFTGLGGLANLLLGGSSEPVVGEANGTFNAFATGTARNVSIRNNQEALVNELGEEGIVRDGKLIPIKGGAQLVKLKKNDIIFNHKQMEDLKKHGYTTGRGKLVNSAYVNGTLNGIDAFYYGSGGGKIGGTKTKSGSTRDSLDGTNDIEDVIDETTEDIEEASKEVFDWIERRISKLQRLTDKWFKNAETALTSGFIMKYFNKAAKTLNKELSVQEQAFHRYQAEADKSGLSDDWKKKVNDGLVDIETITDETLAEQINDYQNWHDKSIASLEAFATAAEKRFNIPLEKAKAKIENFNETLDLLSKKLDNARFSTQKQLESANKLVDQQSKQEKKILNAYKRAEKNSEYNLRKQSKAMKSSSVLNGDDVSKSDRKKIKDAVKNGKEINLSLFKEGSKAYQQAVKYNEALKANEQATYDLAVAQEEYNRWLVEASKIKFDNVAQFYENQIKMLDYQMTDVENRLNEVEKAGLKVNRSYYDLQKQINADTLKYYQEERVKLEESLKGIKKGTEEWYDAYDAIKQIDEEISNCITTTYELNEAIRQLYFDAHEGVRSDIDAIIDEQEFLTSLFAHEDRASADIGNLTDAGIASLGSAVAKMNLSEERAKADETLLKQLQDIYTKYQSGDKNALLSSNLPFDSVEQLEDAIKDLYQTWQDDIKTTYDMQAEVVDIMTEKYEAELEMYQNLVDAKKEALQAEKDLHDYARKIEEKTKNITNLQMRLAAYSGDTSQEGMAKRQQLESQLSEAKDDLQEEEWQKMISDTQEMLDGLITEYQELIQKKLDDFYILLEEGNQISKENLPNIKSYLEQVATTNGYTQATTNLFTTPADKIVDAIKANNTVKQTDVEDVKKDSVKPVNDSSSTTNTPASPSKEELVSKYQKSAQQVSAKKDEVYRIQTELSAVSAELNQKGLSKAQKEKLTVKQKELESRLDTTTSALNESKVKLVKDYMDAEGTVAQKEKSEYSDVNKKLYSKFGKKILSAAELRELAGLLGVSYNNAKKSGNLYKELQKIGLFKYGGVAKLVKSKGEDGIAMVRNGEALVAPEHVPILKDTLDNMSFMRDFTESLKVLPNLPTSNVKQSMGSVVHIDTLTLPNVTNYDEFKTQMMHDMQRDKNFESMVQDMTVNRISGSGRLTKYRQNL